MSTDQELTHEERLEVYDEALLVRREFDHNRAELLEVALSVYVGHAASADGPVTIQSALKKAEELIGRVDNKTGSRPAIPSYPKEY